MIAVTPAGAHLWFWLGLAVGILGTCAGAAGIVVWMIRMAPHLEHDHIEPPLPPVTDRPYSYEITDDGKPFDFRRMILGCARAVAAGAAASGAPIQIAGQTYRLIIDRGPAPAVDPTDGRTFVHVGEPDPPDPLPLRGHRPTFDAGTNAAPSDQARRLIAGAAASVFHDYVCDACDNDHHDLCDGRYMRGAVGPPLICVCAASDHLTVDMALYGNAYLDRDTGQRIDPSTIHERPSSTEYRPGVHHHDLEPTEWPDGTVTYRSTTDPDPHGDHDG